MHGLEEGVIDSGTCLDGRRLPVSSEFLRCWCGNPRCGGELRAEQTGWQLPGSDSCRVAQCLVY